MLNLGLWVMASSLRDDDDDDNIVEPTESTRPGGSWNLRYFWHFCLWLLLHEEIKFVLKEDIWLCRDM
jgi:hypothetical protein